jgi:hypothetical protein
MNIPATLTSPQEQWEILKLLIRSLSQEYGRSESTELKETEHSLQQQRLQQMDQQYVGPELKDPKTAQLEQLLEEKIETESKQAMLRSATRWTEQGEKNNKYFFNVIKQRQRQQTMQCIRCPDSNHLHSDTPAMLQEARKFYTQLYTPDPIDEDAINQLLASIPESCCLSSDERFLLTQPATVDDLESILKHSPAGKSPGLDGLPFEVYSFLFFKLNLFRNHLVQIINAALQENQLPGSWSLTRMVLLFKKGDAQLLKNWRPLSLINTDAKLFTKLLANRLNSCISKLINPYQTGFMQNRLISDNGWVHQALMDHLKATKAKTMDVSVLLDQEKAYDRVNSMYLEKVLLHIRFPRTLVTVIIHLFYNTQISLSINGWLGTPSVQQRGLRQGDPLSPLLFNLAFEPLLRHILASDTIPGLSLPYALLYRM